MPAHCIRTTRLHLVADLDRDIAAAQVDDRIANSWQRVVWMPSRSGRRQLPAEDLLPGDTVLIDGYVLTLTDLHFSDTLAILSFRDFNFNRSVPRRRLITFVRA
jgi:hypothetical protein